MARVTARLGKAARLYWRVSGGEIVRLVFLGSPAFALPTLEAGRAAGYEIALGGTQPHPPAGRGPKSHPTPGAAYAIQHPLPLCPTPSLKRPVSRGRARTR